MITMATFVIVIASVSSIFLGLVNQFKQQSKIAETSLEGLTGLEILRQDLEHAGYGVPWNVEIDGDGDRNDWEQLLNYNEATGNPFNLNDAPNNPPRAIISGNNVSYSAPNDIFDGSDYLVIKAVNVARNDACKKWTTLRSTGTRNWDPVRENVNRDDDGTINNNVRVITLAPGSTDADGQSLVTTTTAPATFFTTYDASLTATPWQPTDINETRIVYGVDSSTGLRRPFNRADYLITTVDSDGTNITPQRCAPNTGVLVKATMNHDNNGTYTYLPLLDCVADMQVIFRRDINGDGTIDNTTDDISALALTAEQIRDQIKEVRVYILAHEGQRDVNYTYPNNSITLGEFGLGSIFDLTGITNYQNYRWKIYTIVVNPNNLGTT
jgi:hypothetical protein